MKNLGIENAYQRIKFALRSAFKAHQLQLESYERIVSLLDPHKILDRGYAAIVNEDGELIRSLSDLDKKNEFTIHLSDGNRKVSIRLMFFTLLRLGFGLGPAECHQVEMILLLD